MGGDFLHQIDPKMMAMVPITRQYNPKYKSFPLRTMDNIHLQAISPDTKAAANPTINGNHPIESDAADSRPSKSIKLAATIGIITIRNEKRAASSLFFPRNNAVVIVAPDLEIPGKIATA